MHSCKKYSLLLLWFCILQPLNIIAQPQDLKFKNYDNISGLENRNGIVRDSLGYIWLTGNGLTRFDGNQLKAYRRNDNIPNSLRSDNTNDLIVDKNGTPWLVSGGLCYYSRAIDGFIYVINNTDKNVSVNDAVVYDGKETIWFCSQFGLNSVNINTKKIRETSLKNCPYPNKAIVDDTGKVWISLWHGGLDIYNPADDSFKKFMIYDGSNSENFRSIFITMQNKIWIAKDEGFIEIDPQQLTDKWGKIIFKEISGLQRVSVSVWMHPIQYLPAYTGDSVVWIATDSHGLITFNTNTQEIVATYLPDKTNPHAISSNTPRSLYVDKNNHLWITQSNGLSLLNFDSQNFKSRVVSELDQPYAMIISFEQDKGEKDIVWIGTNYGILKYNWTQKKTVQYIKNGGAVHVSDANTISDDGMGNLWIGSGNTLYSYNKTSNTFTQYPQLPADNKFSYETVITKLLNLHDTILIATTTGLMEYLVKQKKYKTLYTGIDKGMDYNSFNLYGMELDAQGLLWCGGMKGLLKLDLKTNKHQLYLFNDEKNFNGFNRFGQPNFDGDTIVLAASAGVILFNKSTGQFSKLAPVNDVDLNNSWDVKIDTSHNLWITTYYGLVFYDLKKKLQRTFTVADGLPRSFSNTWIDFIDNKIVFKWRNKFAYIDPYSVEKNNSIPQPIITDFRIFDKPVLFDPAFVSKKDFNLTYKQNYISFDFNAFEFNYPDKIQFAYRLKGFDNNWLLSGNKKNATYTNLPGGNYVFEMKAANSEGLWSEPAVFRIYIKAAFWQTLWFKIFSAIIVAIIIYWAVRRRIKKIRMEEEQKTQINKVMAEAEMKALRSQMNPHFIFNSLNSIQKYIWENKQENASEYLTKFARLMRSVLENSGSKMVTLESELTALKLYVELEHRRSNNKFDYQVNVSDCLDITAILVPPLILQPYVENAIWHGLLPKEERGNLSIHILPDTDDYLQCIIEDNGVGRQARGKAKLQKTRPHRTECI